MCPDPRIDFAKVLETRFAPFTNCEMRFAIHSDIYIHDIYPRAGGGGSRGEKESARERPESFIGVVFNSLEMRRSDADAITYAVPSVQKNIFN